MTEKKDSIDIDPRSLGPTEDDHLSEEKTFVQLSASESRKAKEKKE